MTPRNRLGAKILAVMGGVLVATSIASLAVVLPLYRNQLLNERQTVAAKLAATLQLTLENAMLKRDIEGLREIVDRLGDSKDVSLVMIVNPDGEVRFSSQPSMLGHKFKDVAEICPTCAIDGVTTATGAAFMRGDAGAEVLRGVNAVANREPCAMCHGPAASQPINGFLVVDFSAADIRQRAATTAALLGGVGFVIVLGALLATWYALRRLVFKPIAELTSASRALAAGDLSARAALGGTASPGAADEMGALGRQFDSMAERLQDIVDTLRERDEYLQAVIDAIPDGIRVISPDFSVYAANAAFCDQIGMTLPEVLRVPCYAASHKRTEPCEATMVVCPLVALRDSGASVKCMHTHIDGTSGTRIAVEVIAAAFDLPTRLGVRRYVVESIRDLTRAVEVSQEQRLSEIGLLATGVAHEIHNPLASIRLGLSAIRRSVGAGKLPSDVAQYLGMIDTEIDRCLEVTGRLMWLSQPPGERGELVDLDRVAHDVVALLQYDAEARQIDVSIDVPSTARIIANSREIGMVLLNLIQNAFHACKSGDAVRIVATAAAQRDVRVTVADSGAGIAAENIANIFQPFWSRRADGSTGSGLGLAICKTIITKWRGQIEVESMPGRGTTFTLVFPHAEQVMLEGGPHA